MNEADFPVNLDDAGADEVASVESFARTALAVPFAVAHGLSVPEARDALRTIADYCRSLRESRAARSVGRVAVAMVHERVNQDRFEQLPECLRW